MDLTDLTIHPGKIHLVREILRDGVTGSVRVLGSLKSYDAATDVAVVDYKGDQLTIDACLLTDFQFRIDSLYEFIGEVQNGPSGKKVKARVCRNVDGLDTHLFERALQVRRAFLADPAYQVKVHFKPIANAPILRKSKFQVNSAWTCSELEASLRSMLQISDATPLVSVVANKGVALFPRPARSAGDTALKIAKNASGARFLYCNSAFEPSPDQSLSDLYKCFNVNKELLMNYSITEAWV